jgi:hypothetical protein
MRITIPEDIDNSLKLLPNGHCTAILTNLVIGKSKTGNPKATAMYTVTSEMFEDPSEGTTVGEKVLETFSLQPQALFNINGLYKSVTGENIPQGDYDLEEFVNIVLEVVKGQEFNLILEGDITPNGQQITKVAERTYAG